MLMLVVVTLIQYPQVLFFKNVNESKFNSEHFSVRNLIVIMAF